MNSARALAVAALCEVDDKGAYAQVALDRALSSGRVAGLDRGLVTELVYGVLRRRGTLDWAIDSLTKGRLATLQTWVKNGLRVGLYQLMYMRRIPPSAACDESVEAVKAHAPRAAGLTNAVLRRYLRAPGDVKWPDQGRSPERFLAVTESHPEWLVRRWVARLGFEEAAALLAANNEEPPLTLRVNTLRSSREAVAERLATKGIATQPTTFAPQGLRVEGAGVGSPGQLDVVREGLVQVQDESSMLVGLLVNPSAGEEVLDTCSAPGGKTTHLAELMRNEGRVVACDIYPAKLVTVTQNAARLGLTNITPEERDARTLSACEEFSRHFDKVLVDAPCSGLGVLRRRPDARWRKTEEDIRSLAEVQRSLLEAASTVVKPGGRLVYSTCTTEPEEDEDVIEEFLAKHPQFTLLPAAGALQSAGVSGVETLCSGPYLRLWPQTHATDGFFAACLQFSKFTSHQ